MVINLKEQVKKYVLKNRKNLVVLLTVYVIGIIIGLALYILVQSESKNEIVSSIEQTISMTYDGSFTGVNILKNGLQTNIICILVILFSSFTIITFVVVSAVTMLKGISLSMYICLLFKVFGFVKGIIAMLGMAIVPNIIITAAYIYLSNECYASSLKILTRINKESITKNVFSNIVKAVAIIPFIILAIYIEQIFFRLVIGM